MNNDPFNLKRKCVVGNIINLAVFDYKHKFQTVCRWKDLRKIYVK